MPPDAPEPKPRLELVGGEGPGRAAPAGRPAPGAGRSARRLAPILGALLALAALALFVQTRRAAELASAREELAAYRGQMGRVRALMDGLAARVEELRALVARDPAEPPPHPFEARRP